MLVTQSRGHSSKKHRLLPPSAPSSTIRAGFHQPTGDRIPQTWPSSPRSEQEGFFHSTVVTQAFGETVPNFPPPLPAPCCHSGPGQSLGEGAWSCFFLAGEVRATLEDAEEGGQGMQNYHRRSREASEGNPKRVGWDGGEDFCSCFWTNQEHRGVSGHRCLQLRCRHGNGWFCR